MRSRVSSEFPQNQSNPNKSNQKKDQKSDQESQKMIGKKSNPGRICNSSSHNQMRAFLSVGGRQVGPPRGVRGTTLRPRRGQGLPSHPSQRVANFLRWKRKWGQIMDQKMMGEIDTCSLIAVFRSNVFRFIKRRSNFFRLLKRLCYSHNFKCKMTHRRRMQRKTLQVVKNLVAC